MKVSSAFPSDYVKAADLNGKNVRVLMSGVDFAELNGERKLVLKFKNAAKGMILNKTNANNIAAVYGDDTDDWMGKEIVLFSAWVDFQGKTVEAIRVRGPQPRDASPVAPAQSRQAQPRPAPQQDPREIDNLDPPFDDSIPF